MEEGCRIEKEALSFGKEFSRQEKFRLVDQIIRASRSVTANIAEGYGRFHYQEFVQFCRQSRGSLFELMDHLIVTREQEYITDSQLGDFKNRINECLAVLNGFINYLIKAKDQNRVSEVEMNYYTPTTINY